MAKMARVTDAGMKATPAARDIWLSNPFQRGSGVFMGRVRPNGERLFYFRYTPPVGERKYWPIGPYHPKGDSGGLTVAQAASKAAELSALYRSGIKDIHGHFERETSIAEQRQAAELKRLEAEAAAEALASERRLTIRQLADRWQKTDLVMRKRPDGSRMGRKDGGDGAVNQLKLHAFPVIGERTASEVRRADILTVIDSLMAAGKERTAQLVFADLRQMFRFGLDRELIEVDPMATMKKANLVGKPVVRQRLLSPDEIRLLASALPKADLSPRSVCAVWLTLATGVRAGELGGATWASDLPIEPLARRARIEALVNEADAANLKAGFIDFEARTWYMPTTKMERPHTIHLSDFAVRQLETLRALRETCCWVFPAGRNKGGLCSNKPLNHQTFGKQLDARQQSIDAKPLKGRRTKFPQSLVMPDGDWTAHDLRRTTGTLIVKCGFSDDVSDACLNHKEINTYIVDNCEAEQPMAFDALGARLFELTEGKAPPSNVRQFKAA